MDRLNPSMHEALKEDVLELLYKKKIYMVLDFLESDTKLLQRTSGLTFKEIHGIRKMLLKKYTPRHRNGVNYYKQIITSCSIIPTGIKSLDALLEGGLYTGNIYELCGLPASGKTYFCLTLLCNILQKGPDNAIYLDTKYDFSATKLKGMLTNSGSGDVYNMLNRVIVKRTITRPEFMNSLFAIKDKIENGFPVKLLIIDSLPVLYNEAFNHTETNSFLNHTANILRYISNELNVAVIITNLVTLWNEGDFKSLDKFKEKIYCGSYWYNIPNVRLHLKRDFDLCIFALKKTFKVMPLVQEGRAEFTGNGIQ